MARSASPSLSQLRTWPSTFGFQSPFVPIHASSAGWRSPSGRYQCVVSRWTGTAPESVLRGSMRSSGERLEPQFSHWSP